MPKLIYIIAALLCCWSCSTDEVPFSVPEIPAGDRHSYVEEQLSAAHSLAEQNPHSADALGRFAIVLHKYGMHEQAASAYGQARRLAPGDFRWAYLHGHVLEALGQDTQARDAFAAAAKIDRKAGTTYLGVVLLKLGEIEAARETLLESLAYDEQKVRALYELGRLETAEGNLDLAEDYLSRSLELGSTHPSVYYALAEIKKRQGEQAQAAEYLERFAETKVKGASWPDRWLAGMRTSDTDLMSAAVRALQRGDINRAIELNEQARELNPDNPLPPAALIGLYAIVGEHEKSEDALSIARELDPDSAQFHYNVGLARMAQNRLADAEAAMLRVTDIDPHGSLAWTKLGTIYAARGDRDKSIDAFAEAHERNPADDEVRLKLGVLNADAQRYESALMLLEAPTVGDQNEARRLWAVGRVHRHLGNPEQAAAALKNAHAAAIRAGDTRLAGAIRGELDRLDATASD